MKKAYTTIYSYIWTYIYTHIYIAVYKASCSVRRGVLAPYGLLIMHVCCKGPLELAPARPPLDPRCPLVLRHLMAVPAQQRWG